MAKIDFVLPWVDDTDPAWRQQRMAYSGQSDSGTEDVHFRDWQLLRFWFRGVEKYAPWVDQIHFITWGHLPAWLNTEHPKLHIVRHSDYIPEEYLPTFSSHVIELNMHRIKELSEQFVYFNDDVFLVNPVSEGDFFHGALPCDFLVESAITPRNRAFSSILVANAGVINDHFTKRDLKKQRGRYFNLKYKKLLVRTLSTMPYQYIMGFYNAHICQAYNKSTFDEVWEQAYDALDTTCRHRFRGLNDVNQYLIRNWALCKGAFYPSAPLGKFMRLDMDIQKITRAVRQPPPSVKCLTLNDAFEVKDVEGLMKTLQAAFLEKFPEKSAFELTEFA